jgi:hypothetical protein
MSSQKIARKVLDVDSNVVRFIFSDGTSRTVRISDLPEEIVHQAAMHGISQKLGDCYAAATTKADEAGVDAVEWAIAEFDSVLESIMAGDWNRRGGSGESLTTKALAEATGATLEEAIAAWNGADEAKRKAIRKHPAFKAIYLRMQQEAAQDKANRAGTLIL